MTILDDAIVALTTAVSTLNTTAGSAQNVAVATATEKASLAITQASIATTKAGEANASAIAAAASAAALNSGTIDINGGTVDGAVIGGAAPAAGSFTTLSASGGYAAKTTVAAMNPNAGAEAIYTGSKFTWEAVNSASGWRAQLVQPTNVFSDNGDLVFSYGNGIQEAIRFKNQFSAGGSGLSVIGGISATGALTTNGLKEDASGNLGLGVTPSAWGSATRAYEGFFSSVYSFATDRVQGGMATNARSTATPTSGDTWVYRYGSYGAGRYAIDQGQHIWYTAPSGTAGAAISFTQAMTLDAGGNLLVGTTAANVTNGGFLASINGASSYLSIGHVSGTPNNTWFESFQLAGVSIGSITQSGSTAVLYNTTSDARLKTNVVNAPDAASLIDAIQVRSFDWLSDGSHQRYGFVAQELYEVAPEAVSKPANPDEMMAVDYSKLVPMLVKEIQSLRQRLATAGI